MGVPRFVEDLFSADKDGVLAQTPEEAFRSARDAGFPGVRVFLVVVFYHGAGGPIKVHTETELREILNDVFKVDPRAQVKVIPSTDPRFLDCMRARRYPS